MNVISKRALAHALFISLAVVALPGRADPDATPTAAMVAVCQSSQNGMVPTEKVTKALHKVLDMADPQKSMSPSDKQARRNKQFQVFWQEFTRESGG